MAEERARSYPSPTADNREDDSPATSYIRELKPRARRLTRSYDLFISYSLAADGQLAPAVQRAFERLGRLRPGRARMRVVRDQTGFSVTEALWPWVEQTLRRSQAFLFLASPEAACSAWVLRELDSWLEERSELLIGLTGGELVWDEFNGDFDWSRTTAIPRALEGYFVRPPQWVDLRWAQQPLQLSLHDPRFNSAMISLVAHALGTDENLLYADVVRRAGRQRWLAAAGGAAVLSLAVGSAAVGLRQGRIAEESAGPQSATQRLAAAGVEPAAPQRAQAADRAAPPSRHSPAGAPLPPAGHVHAAGPKDDSAGERHAAGLEDLLAGQALARGEGPSAAEAAPPPETARAAGRAQVQAAGEAPTADAERQSVGSAPPTAPAGEPRTPAAPTAPTREPRTPAAPTASARELDTSSAAAPRSQASSTGSADAQETVMATTAPSDALSGTGSRNAQPVATSSRDAQPVATSSRDAQPVATSSRNAQPVATSSRNAQPVATSSRDAQPVATGSRDVQPVAPPSAGAPQPDQPPARTRSSARVKTPTATSPSAIDRRLLLAVESASPSNPAAAQDALGLVLAQPHLDQFLQRPGTPIAGIGYDAAAQRLYWLTARGQIWRRSPESSGRHPATPDFTHYRGFWFREQGNVALFDRTRLAAVAAQREVAAYVDGPQIHVLGLSQRREQVRIALSQEPVATAVALDAKGAILAVGHDDGRITLWNTTDGARQQVLQPGPDAPHPVTLLAFSPSGSELAAAGADGRLTRWTQTARGWSSERMGRIEPDARGLRYDPRGERLMAFGPRVRVWQAGAASTLDVAGASGGAAQEAAWLPEGRFVTAGADGSVARWSLEDVQVLRRTLGAQGAGDQALWVSAHGERAITIDAARRLRHWALQPEVRQAAGFDLPVSEDAQILIAPGGEHIVTGDAAGALTAWSSQTPQPRALASLLQPVVALATDADGDRVAAAGQQGRIVVRALTGLQQEFFATEAGVALTAVALDSWGQRLAAASAEGDILLWDLASGGQQRIQAVSKAPLTQLAFSMNGIWLAARAQDGRVYLYRGGDYAPAAELQGQPGSQSSAMRFSADSKRIWVAAEAGIQGWSLRQPAEPPVTLAGQGGQVAALATANHDGYLLSALRGGEVSLWDTRPESWLAEACRMANRTLSAEEWQRAFPERPYAPRCLHGRLASR